MEQQKNHPPETKDGLLTGRFQLISVFETSDREQALACVKNIYLMHQYPEQFADAYTFFDIPKLFYAPLHKLERNDEISPPPRPPQTVGNCFFRGPNEIVLWCLQRQGEDELANAYLDSMFETCRKSSHLYPALQDLLDQQSPYYLEAFPDKKECLAG